MNLLQKKSTFPYFYMQTLTVWLPTGATPDGISVDQVSGLLFYTDTGYNIIALITLEGTYSKTVINQDLDEPRAIVTNPQTG